MTLEKFAEALGDAYAHLYDIVHLRTHALLDVLARPDGSHAPAPQPTERAWQMHRLLLDAIHELKPPAGAGVLSRQWRRHRLMVLRYIKALEPQAVADELNISRRHFYREHGAAMEALASILWARYADEQQPPAPPNAPAPRTPDPLSASAPGDNLALLRMEAARMAQANRYASIASVCESAAPLVAALLHERDLTTRWCISPTLPHVTVDPNLLKQLLLGLVGLLAEQMGAGAIQITGMLPETPPQDRRPHVSDASATNTVHLLLAGERADVTPAPGHAAADLQERLTGLTEMASLGGATLHPLLEADDPSAAARLCGFRLELTPAQRTVLVVDDNEDVLHLFRRYLTPHHYHVVTTQQPQEVQGLARQLQPLAITLDLMMPGQDGWDLLQTLLHQPETRHIPLVVCSVLKQEELALALGATAFIEKPVTEQRLLSVLDALQNGKQS